jgi:hypothetical protein
MKPKAFLLPCALVGALLLGLPGTAAAAGGPEVIRASRVGVSPALRDLPAAAAEAPAGEAVAINPLGGIGRVAEPDGVLPASDDWALQEFFTPGDAPAAIPAPTLTFDGMNNTFGVLPPDTTGDVGPRHYVQMVNLGIAVYDKATGAVLLAPRDTNLLWTGFGGLCESHNDGDPIVLYDPLADRWLVSQFVYQPGNYRQCIAISQSGDPTGTYWLYDFLYSTTIFHDYPHLGVWPDGYYMTANQFGPGGWDGGGVAVFERSQMLVGGTARMIRFDLGNATPLGLNYGGQLPGDWDGGVPIPAGSPNFVMQWDDSSWIGDPTDTLRVWRVDVDWVTPANSTVGTNANFDPNHFLPTADANVLNCPSVSGQERPCIPQPGTAVQLDAIGDGRLMHRMPIRNFGTHDSMLATNTVGVGASNRQAAPRWYEIRGLLSGSPTVHQQGTYAPDGTNRWMASLAMDAQGNVLLGYSAASAAVHPALRYTGRLAGDPLGQMPQGEAVLFAGAGSQTSTSNRWGDYSTMSVDPKGDECGFWYTNEYYASNSSASWRTRIGTAAFSGCLLLDDGYESGGTSSWSAVGQ